MLTAGIIMCQSALLHIAGAVVDPLEDSAPTDEEAFAEISSMLSHCIIYTSSPS